MFRAAFTSRSCGSPQPLHVHALTASCLRPCGPLSEPHCEQTREVFHSLTTSTDLPACSPFVLQHLPEHSPSAVEHGLRQPRSRQLRRVHVANDDVLILVDDPAAVCRASRRRLAALRCKRFAWRLWPQSQRDGCGMSSFRPFCAGAPVPFHFTARWRVATSCCFIVATSVGGGGEGGIRTLDTPFGRIHTFQACAFNHSATSPILRVGRERAGPAA